MSLLFSLFDRCTSMAPEQRGDFAALGASPSFDSSPGSNQRFVTPVVTAPRFHNNPRPSRTQLGCFQLCRSHRRKNPFSAIECHSSLNLTQHKTMQIRRVWAVLAACQLFWQLAGLQKAKKEQHKSVLFAVCLSRDASGPRTKITKQNSQAFRTIPP